MKVVRGDIHVNFYDDILRHMEREEKVELAAMVCMDDEVLDHFLSELMTGYASSSMDSHIHNARQKFVDLMPEAAANLVRALNAEVQRSRAEAEHYRNEAFRMERRFPINYHCQEPGCTGSFYLPAPERKLYPSVSTPMSDQIMKSCGFAPVVVNDSETEGWL